MQTLLIVPIVSRKIREVVLLRNIGYDPFITVRKRRCGKVMFSQVCANNSVHREGRCTPPRQTPPGLTPSPGRPPGQTHTPLDRHPPEQTHTPGQTPPPIRRPVQRTVRILLKCILVMKSNTMRPSGRTLVAQQIVIYYLKGFKPILWNVVFSQNGRCADVFVFFLHTLSM